MLSIISPVHKTSAPYLIETYASLMSNDYTDWQWVLVPNRGGEIPEQIAHAPRVKIVPTHDDEGEVNSIGRLKRFACAQADGDVLVELDADDLLLPWSLRKIAAAFENPATAMVYSNDCEFQDGSWESRAYSEYWGWRSRDFFWQGHARSSRWSLVALRALTPGNLVPVGVSLVTDAQHGHRSVS